MILINSNLLKFQRQVFRKLTGLVEGFFLDSKIFGMLIAIGCQGSTVTQQKIAEITDWSAGRISEVLNQLLRMGFIIRVKIPGSRKKGYRLKHSLIKTYEMNFKRILTQFESSFTLPKQIMEGCRKLEQRFPNSSSLGFFQKYLELYAHSSEYILDLVKNFSLENEVEKPLSEIISDATLLQQKFKSFYQPTSIFIDRAKRLQLTEPGGLKPALKDLMRNYLDFFSQLMLKTEKQVDAGLTLNSFFINYYPLTQNDLIELTGIPRSTLSGILKSLVKQNFLIEFEISGDRKKYYHVSFPREAFLLGKQLKSLQITIQMEQFISQMLESVKKIESHENNIKMEANVGNERNERNEGNEGNERNARNEENDENKENEEKAFIRYLVESKKALRRLNTQMLPILQSLASYAENLRIKKQSSRL